MEGAVFESNGPVDRLYHAPRIRLSQSLVRADFDVLDLATKSLGSYSVCTISTFRTREEDFSSWFYPSPRGLIIPGNW